jgi:hypothetical protein
MEPILWGGIHIRPSWKTRTKLSLCMASGRRSPTTMNHRLLHMLHILLWGWNQGLLGTALASMWHVFAETMQNLSLSCWCSSYRLYLPYYWSYCWIFAPQCGWE